MKNALLLGRRQIMLTSAAFLAASGRTEAKPAGSDPYAASPWRKLGKNEWRARLSPAAFAVLREDDTESPRSSLLDQEKRRGVFACAGCALPLFRSEAKFDSGTGWPSFVRPIAGAVTTKRDLKLIFPRTEYHCARCLGHQGHRFNDGPPPTGKRWCNNGVALKFVVA